MTREKKSPAGGPGAEHSACRADAECNAKRRRRSTLTKRGRILHALLRGEKLTRMDAWRDYGDAVLPSTVAELQSLHGLQIARRYERVEGRFCTATVARYWIAETERETATQALAAELCKAGMYPSAAEALEALKGAA